MVTGSIDETNVPSGSGERPMDITEAELRGAQVMLDLSPQLLRGLHAYFLHGVSLTDSGKIADLSRQAMRYKINYVRTSCERTRKVIRAIGKDSRGHEWLTSLLGNLG